VKALTREQLQSRKDKAVRFVRDVMDDPERASEIEDEDLEDYAERKKVLLSNRRRKQSMAGGNGGNGRTKQDLLDEIDDLQQQNQDLQDQLDAIADIVSPEEEDDDDDSDEDDSDDDD
jgi:hypothetical protein